MSGPTLVTGAGGFLGGHVVATLVTRGESVRAMDVAFPAPLPDGVERIEGSILDEALLREATTGARAVIHCAAATDLWIPRPVLYDRVNMRGTCEVLIAARRAGARMVHVSCHLTLVGGPDRGEAVLDESLELTPSDMLGPYPRTKREAELAVLSAARLGQEAVIVLPSLPVGPGDHRPTAAGQLLRDLATGRVPALPECRLNLVDVRAVAEGVIAARDRGRRGARYLLTGEDIGLAELALREAGLTGVAPPRLRSRAPTSAEARIEAGLSRLTGRPPGLPMTALRVAARRVRFSPARAREELGFTVPPVGPALADAITWMRNDSLLRG